ncbi:SCP2 sterol-binding domain containing protein [Tylopilus felleus]|jgi:putative sterol carrier protein
MSDIKVDGFRSADILDELSKHFGRLPDAERAAQVKKTAAIFEIRVKNADKQEAVFTIDLKDQGSIYAGPVRAPGKPGVVLIMSDDTFADIASGKMDGQKAFMTGKLKSKGNLMLATKLGAVLGATKAKAKL